MEKVSMFSIGDMVEYLNVSGPGCGSIGVVSGPSAYEGFPLITFISGPDAGKTYAVNSGALKRLTGEEEQNPVIKEEIAVVEEKPAAKPVPAATPAPAARKKWSKVEVVAMIKEKDVAVERGILCLNKHHQRIPEKSRPYVSYWAEYLTSGKHLTGRHLFNARRTCYFNAKVLVDAANGVI
jgi:hypothetical protein